MATAQTSTIDIRKYLFVLKRRAVLSITIFLTVLSVGVAYCLWWPPIYQATCLVLVQPQKVPTELVKASVTTKIQERLQIITQQVLSRSRLMEIIERFNLYPHLRDKLTPDELAQAMRKDVSIKISTKNYFTIEYLYSDAQTVASVANALAAFYVDSNLRLREEDAVGTARFLSRELERVKGQLAEWEKKITDFKEAHLQELPENQEKNVSMLGQMQNREVMVNAMIQAERNRLNAQETELGVLEFRAQYLKIHRARAIQQGVNLAGGAGSEEEQSSKAIKQQIDKLRIIYTEDHPDIARLKGHMARALAMEAEQKARKDAERKAHPPAPGKEEEKPKDPSDVELESTNLSKERLALRIKEGADRVNQWLAEKAEIAAQAEQAQKHIENGPAVAEKLTELTRGYESLKTSFEKLQAKALEANLSANLERTQRGEQFEVVDPAEVPDSPYRPSVKRAIPASLGLGLALALGLSLGLNFLDTSFTSVEQMERQSNFPVLVVVLPLDTGEEERRKKLWTTVLIVIYGGYFMLLMGLMALLVTGKAAALKALILRMVA